jgi:hypothetical protein
MLSPELNLQLRSIEPSTNFGRMFYPCAVGLKDGSVLRRVYFVDGKTFGSFSHHKNPPEDVPGVRRISSAAVDSIQESPDRLPVRFANLLYREGETGMGYYVFTVVFSRWSKKDFLTGGFVDFIDYPPGRRPADVREVIPHAGRRVIRAIPEFYWCVSDE